MINQRARQFIRRGAWLILPLAALLFFSGPLVRNQVLIPGDILGRVDDIWASQIKPHNALLSDVVLQFYPWQKYAFEHLRNGEIPLWNPHVLNGTPFLANDQSAIFDPLRLLVFVLGFSAAQSFLPLAILRLGLFGLFVWLFLRQRNISLAGSWAAGLSAVVAVPMVAWVSYPLAAAFVWFPLILYATDRVLQKLRWGFVLLTTAIAAQAFSGNIQMTLFEMIAVLTYALYVQRPFDWRRITTWVLAVLLGFSLAAVQLLPTATFLAQSQQSESGRRGYADATWSDIVQPKAWLSWTSLTAVKADLLAMAPIALPFINGNPATDNYRYPGQNPLNNFNELAGAIGFLGFLVALYGIKSAWRDRLGKFTILGTGLSLGVAAHAPIFELVNYLPLINLTTTGRIRFFIAFGLLVLLVYGVRELWQAGRAAWKRLMLISAASLLVYLVVLWKFTPDGTKTIDGTIVALSLAVLLAALWFQGKWWRGPAIAIALIAQPVIMLLNFNTAVPADTLYPSNQRVDMIKQYSDINHRVIGLSSDGTRVPLAPNGSMILGLYDPRGYEVVRSRRYDELTKDILIHSGSSINRIEQYTPLLDVLGVTATLMNADDQDAGYNFMSQGNNTFAQDGDLVYYVPRDAYPYPITRAFVANTVNVASTPAEALKLVRERARYDSPVVENVTSMPKTNLEITPAMITAETANAITITATSQTGGYLILSDTYDPGWRATVDDQPATIYIANYAFRAVPVTAGTHTVKFVYAPRSFKYGAWVSIGSLLVVLGLVVVELRRRKPKQ